MRRILLTVLGCCLVTAILAPAAQAGGGVRDFQLAITPDGKSKSAAPSGPRTIHVNPRRSFDLVGLRWRSGFPRLALRSYGRSGWSEWTTTSGDRDDPVWTGRSTKLQLRVTGSVRGLRGHFVSISTNTTQRLARAAGSGGVAPGTTPRKSPAGKTGAAPPPSYVTRQQWGAESSCKPRRSPGYGEVLGAVVHHTVSTNSYSQAQAPSVVLAICRYHRNANGWNDIGYNVLVDRFGTIYEGRGGGVDRAVAGAHAQGYNGQTTGVALVGSHTHAPPTAQSIASMRTWLAWKLALHGVVFNERIPLVSTGGRMNRFPYGRMVFARAVSGHRDLDSTSCPGNQAYAQIGALNSMLQPSSRRVTRLSIRLRRGATGSQTIYATGRIRGAGKLAANKSVLVQRYDDVGWVTIDSVMSDPDGIWRATVSPGRRSFLRVAFDGDGGLRKGRSIWQYAPKLP